MKVLFHFRTQGTGAEAVHIAGMAGGFESLGASVRFSSPSGVDPTRSAGANPFRPISRLGKVAAALPRLVFELLELGYNAVAYFRNRRLLKAESFDLIYERHAFFLFSTALLARRQSIPLVVEVNELSGDERVRQQPLLGNLARFLDRNTFERATLIIAVSPHLKRKIAALGIAPENILVLPNAVARATLAQVADGAPVRKRHVLENETVIGFVGWFVPWHRLDRLLRIFAALLPEFHSARLLLVGDGPEGPALRQQAEQLGIADRLVFTGAVAHPEIPAHIAAFDIAVVPHSNEYRSPIKLFEYMAQARAVVAPATEPIAAVITEGENGFLFDPDSETALRQALERALQQEDGRRRLGENARQTILRHHTWEKNAERVIASMGSTRKGVPSASP